MFSEALPTGACFSALHYLNLLTGGHKTRVCGTFGYRPESDSVRSIMHQCIMGDASQSVRHHYIEVLIINVIICSRGDDEDLSLLRYA